MGKNVLKFGLGALALVALAVGVLYLTGYIKYRTSPEYRAEKYFEELAKKYREDTYGGNTPEETLQLFIDALKKGDVELASRYFIYDKQEKWLGELTDIKSKGLVNQMVVDLQRLEKTKEGQTEAFFILTNKDNVVSVQLVIGKSPYSGKWKIYEL